MHRVILIASIVSAACGATSDLPSLVGTWQGTASNGALMTYTFGQDGSFQFGTVQSGSPVVLAAGTFDFALETSAVDDYVVAPTLTLSATAQLTVNGQPSNPQFLVQDLAYASGTTMCDVAYYPQKATNGIEGTWSASSIMWSQTAGGDLGEALPWSDTYTFGGDGTFQRVAGGDSFAQGGTFMDTSGGSFGGTYGVTDDVVTTAIQAGSNPPSYINRSLTRVDGVELDGSSTVLCDPVYTLQ
ncbi:MAG TPA: hypothetical protein VMJ10_31480 [Kofleriaceae bacterium]|nr:hypothetical protein [Kofleriaceae bacterium]